MLHSLIYYVFLYMIYFIYMIIICFLHICMSSYIYYKHRAPAQSSLICIIFSVPLRCMKPPPQIVLISLCCKSTTSSRLRGDGSVEAGDCVCTRRRLPSPKLHQCVCEHVARLIFPDRPLDKAKYNLQHPSIDLKRIVYIIIILHCYDHVKIYHLSRIFYTS